MWQVLAGPLINAGLNTLGTLVGGKAGVVVETIGRGVLTALDVKSPEAAIKVIASDPDAPRKLREWEEASASEYLTLAVAELDLAKTLARQESSGGVFAWAWRPALSWLLVLIIANQFLIAPVLKAAFGIDLSSPYEQVLGVAAIWLTIYGGGHTAKAIFGKKLGA